MRIAVFSRALAEHSSGGMAIAATAVARCLTDSGKPCEVDVFTTRTDSFTGIHESSGVRRHFLAGTTPCTYEGGYYNAATKAWAEEHARRPFDAIVSVSKAAMEVLPIPGRPKMLFTSHGIGIDAVHEGINAALVSGQAGRALEAGVLKGIRSTYIDPSPDIQCTEQEFYLKWDALAGVSLSAVVDLQVRMGHPLVYFLPNAIYDVEWDRPLAYAPARPLFHLGVCAGNLLAFNKGVLASAPLLAALRTAQVQVHLIGDNGQDVTSRIGGHAVAYGKVPQTEAIRLIGEMDAIFDPSIHHSGLNMVVCQAMAMGVPVICYPFGGLTTPVQHGVTGVLVRPQFPGDVERAIQTIRDRRPTMSRNAYSLARLLFHPRTCGQRYLLAIESMLDGSMPPFRT